MGAGRRVYDVEERRSAAWPISMKKENGSIGAVEKNTKLQRIGINVRGTFHERAQLERTGKEWICH